MSSKKAILASMALVIGVPVALSGADYGPGAATALAQGDSRLFEETGQTVQGLFLQYWDSHGGLAQQGYPISGEMQETSDLDGKTYTVQYFERAVFEHHPENAGTEYEVLLSQLGTLRYQAEYADSPPEGIEPSSTECMRFEETGQQACGEFLVYWKEHGGLAQQGFPISPEFTERSDLDGNEYTVQYFERAVFERHPENEPPYNVLLSQLGTFAYGAKYSAGGGLPADLPLDEFYERAFLNLLQRDPETYTGVGLPESYAPGYRHNKLTDIRNAYQLETYGMVDEYLARLRSYDPQAQSPQQTISTRIMEWQLEDMAQGREFMYYDFILNPATGVQVALQDLMVNLHPLNSKEDAEDYVARLREFGTKFDGVVEQLTLREQEGIYPPSWMLQTAIDQMQGLSSGSPTQNELYTYLQARLAALDNVSQDDKDALLTSAEEAIRDVVYPSYGKVIEKLGEMAPNGRSSDGVWDLPNGDAYYRYAIKHYTTTDMSPDEIHEIGLSEVARIRGEMQVILDGLGYGGLSFADAMGRVAEDGGSYSTNTQAAKEELLDAFRAIIADADSRISGQFDMKPRIGVEVRAVPEEKEAGSAGGFYFLPSLDGTRPGIFYVNLGRPNYPKYQIATLAYHEAVPGHHFQLGIQSELESVPTFQRSGVFPSASGYTEGWALYAEQLAYEAGFYDNDPYGNLGRLQAELFRSARLVVDTGIHSKRWNWNQANQYMEDTLGQPPGTYSGEVARYISWPGQALAYKIGQLKILELRERARQELGADFNIKEFHNVLLGNGTVPLEVMETLVEDWIASK